MKARALNLGKGIALPLEAVTETFGILAVRGSGKTNTGRVFAEEMHAAGLPFVVVDPVGSWWGLRASRDGKGQGLPIPIFGGRHGDVPLERSGGELVADLVVDQRLSCVLDLSDFDSEAAKKQFLIDFARRLYRRNEEPLHLFLEEADDYIPQKPMGRDEPMLLRAWENIVRRGRARGLGMTLITQRSAVVNKNVLTQVGTLIAMRTTGPQDRAAIKAWVDTHGQSREILASLPGLSNGEAWVWSPSFLGRTVKVQFRLSTTFDSGATPGRRSGKAAATLADVDLAAIQQSMAATIERAQADDPKALRRRIAELERELAAARKAQPVDGAPELARRMANVIRGMFGTLQGLVAELEQTSKGGPSCPPAGKARERAGAAPSPAISKPPRRREGRTPTPDVRLGKGELATLTVLAQHAGGLRRDQLTVITGYKRSSRDTFLQRLRASGLIEQDGNVLNATDAGIAALGDDYQPLPTGDALRDHYMRELPEGERKVLGVLCHYYPKTIPRDRIDEETGYRRSSRDTYLQRLKARGLIALDRGQVAASEELFG